VRVSSCYFGAFGYEEMGKGHGEMEHAISAFQTGLEIKAKVALLFLFVLQLARAGKASGYIM
jgi:hypothetical protein